MDLRRGYDASRRCLPAFFSSAGTAKEAPDFPAFVVCTLQFSVPQPQPSILASRGSVSVAAAPYYTSGGRSPISRRSSAMASTRDLVIASLSAATGAVVAAAALRLLSSRRTSSVRPQNLPAAANGSASERPLVQSPFDPVKREGFVNVLPPSLAILMPVRSS
jgi:hypothetical protein